MRIDRPSDQQLCARCHYDAHECSIFAAPRGALDTERSVWGDINPPNLTPSQWSRSTENKEIMPEQPKEGCQALKRKTFHCGITGCNRVMPPWPPIGSLEGNKRAELQNHFTDTGMIRERLPAYWNIGKGNLGLRCPPCVALKKFPAAPIYNADHRPLSDIGNARNWGSKNGRIHLVACLRTSILLTIVVSTRLRPFCCRCAMLIGEQRPHS